MKITRTFGKACIHKRNTIDNWLYNKLNNMKNQKQSRIDLVDKKIQALINVVKQLLEENAYLKDLSVGTLETIKNMEGYEDAIEKLKAKMAAEASETKEADANRKIIE